MNKIHNILIIITTTIFLFSGSLYAEDMTLEQAREEISRLEVENQSLKERLATLKEEIAAFKEKIENHEVNKIGNNELSE